MKEIRLLVHVPDAVHAPRVRLVSQQMAGSRKHEAPGDTTIANECMLCTTHLCQNGTAILVGSCCGQDLLSLARGSGIRSSLFKLDQGFKGRPATSLVLREEQKKSQKSDLRRSRTCNLLIRSQTRYHCASRPVDEKVDSLILICMFMVDRSKSIVGPTLSKNLLLLA